MPFLLIQFIMCGLIALLSLPPFQQVRKAPEGLTPALDPTDPLADQDQERREVEALARKFESKYVSRSFCGNRKKKSRLMIKTHHMPVFITCNII